jgi:hypothetical protein
MQFFEHYIPVAAASLNKLKTVTLVLSVVSYSAVQVIDLHELSRAGLASSVE